MVLDKAKLTSACSLGDGPSSFIGEKKEKQFSSSRTKERGRERLFYFFVAHKKEADPELGL